MHASCLRDWCRAQTRVRQACEICTELYAHELGSFDARAALRDARPTVAQAASDAVYALRVGVCLLLALHLTWLTYDGFAIAATGAPFIAPGRRWAVAFASLVLTCQGYLWSEMVKTPPSPWLVAIARDVFDASDEERIQRLHVMACFYASFCAVAVWPFVVVAETTVEVWRRANLHRWRPVDRARGAASSSSSSSPRVHGQAFVGSCAS